MNKKEKSFFTNILRMSQENFLEIRILNIKKQTWFSKYVKTIEELYQVLKTFNTPDYNIYYGTNVRPTKGRKVVDIKFRRFFYFDVEKDGEKPILKNGDIYNEGYFKSLKETIHYIIYSLHKEYGIKPSVLYISGRGLHLGYSHYELPMEYDSKFKLWYKQTQASLEKKKPVAEIKLSDPTRDAARIGGCPGTINYKYPEKPLREILEINPENICDLRNILDNFKMPEFKIDKSVIASGKNRKYNEKTIFDAPEFKVFECKIPEMKGYNVHSRLRVALILLMDKYAIQNREEVARRIESLSYWYEPMTPIENPDYAYTENILLNWCLDNWQLCLEKEFKLPYPLFKNKAYKFIEKEDDVQFSAQELRTPWDIYYFAKAFNNATSKELSGTRTVFYTRSLREHVFKNISDDDLGNKLKKWIEMNDFIEKVKVVR